MFNKYKIIEPTVLIYSGIAYLTLGTKLVICVGLSPGRVWGEIVHYYRLKKKL